MKLPLLQCCVLTLTSIVGSSAEADPPAPVEFINVEISGKIEVGLVAIGGETTGSELSADGWTFELSSSDQQILATAGELAQNQTPAYVKGRFRLVKGIERSDRWVLDVASLSRAEPNTEFVRVECQGRFKANDRIENVIANTVKSSGVRWIADLSAAKNPESVQQLLEKKGVVRLAGEFGKKQARQNVPVFKVTHNKSPLARRP
ncbi:MAG: hypothetical protein O3A00_11190 [Planctomycetota bacterium]|nr:hypothetical protein [Planctomycetota bacterium]